MLPCFGKREMSESATALRWAKEVREPEIHPPERSCGSGGENSRVDGIFDAFAAGGS
jgi:hypothetical protein